MRRSRRRRVAQHRRWQSVRITLGLAVAVFLIGFFLHPKGYARFLVARSTGVPTTEPVSPPASAGPDPVPPPVEPSDTELDHLQVNELGQVMIIMYHDVQDYESEWVRSRENFRADLKRFHDLGYTLVPLSSYLDGHIEVPLGRYPLVLTFDDGTRGQLTMLSGGTDEGALVPDPDCAAGILVDFAEEHPDFGCAATFFINSGNAFGAGSRAKDYIAFLVENGMEIGNHTRTHANLRRLPPDKVIKEVGSLANEIEDKYGFSVTALALPFGEYPTSADNLLHGTWDGRDYQNKGVLLVGAEPAPSPFSKGFDPLAIPRVRGSSEELDKWLRELERNPGRRFVSDGRSDMVTVRAGSDEGLDPDRVGALVVRSYSISRAIF